MSFFEQQARARGSSARLVTLFVLAVVGVLLAVNLVIGVAWRAVIGRGIAPYEIDAGGNVTLRSAAAPTSVFVWTTIVTLAVIGVRTVIAVYGLRAGGDAVARMAGGIPVDRGTRDADQRRLLNIVEEMAIASGVSVPRVWMLPGETGINAFAAGYAPNQAAIAVTEGALRQLTRDELQGVIGHEFSHVLNGDMRLNVRMIGVLAGILFVGEVGEALMRSTRGDNRDSRNGIVLLGLALTLIGYIGLMFGRLIKAGIARQREFLGDASSVQFTRNSHGIAGALAVIGGLGPGSLVQHARAETLSHMFFAQGVSVWFASLFATHPPIPERIRRIDSRFVMGDYFASRNRALAEAQAAAGIATDTQPEPATAAFAGTAPRAPVRPPAALIASVGRPAPEHVEYAAKLLDALPDVVRDAAKQAHSAAALVLAFALDPDPVARKLQLVSLDGDLARRADGLAGHVATLPAPARLAVVALALGALRELDQPGRDALVRHLTVCVDADKRQTLAEFALLATVRAQLRANAARPEPPKYRSILEVDVDAQLVLSVLAHAAEHNTATAFARGIAKLGLRGQPVAADRIAFPKVGEALDRLGRLAPFVKRAFLEACLETVMTDREIKVGEAELLRAIATTLDCPIPPLLASFGSR